jgi:hypothetical protein
MDSHARLRPRTRASRTRFTSLSARPRQRQRDSRMDRSPELATRAFRRTPPEYDQRYVRPTTATDTVNNSHPRFVRLPRASLGFPCEIPSEHSVHGTFHDAPCASATRAVLSWRIVPRVRRFPRWRSCGRHLLESASDVSVASPSPPARFSWSNGLGSGQDRFRRHSVKNVAFRDPTRLSSIDPEDSLFKELLRSTSISWLCHHDPTSDVASPGAVSRFGSA